jgi:hypothetical protein
MKVDHFELVRRAALRGFCRTKAVMRVEVSDAGKKEVFWIEAPTPYTREEVNTYNEAALEIERAIRSYNTPSQ